jgi:alpha-acetolactate decarboxylase
MPHRLISPWPCALLLAAACSTTPPDFAHYGGMREVMRLGHTEPRTALQPFAAPGCYGLGALAGLAGEIVIDDGRVWVARQATAVAEAAATDQATLLAVARVSAWRTVPLAEAADLTALEQHLARAVPDANRSDGAPLPFVIDGTATQLAMHVVRGYCPHGEPVAGAAAPDTFAHANGTELPVRLVGLFAPGRAGLLTHHGTSLHVHALVLAREPGAAVPVALGHVDGLTLAPGAVLRLPQQR